MAMQLSTDGLETRGETAVVTLVPTARSSCAVATRSTARKTPGLRSSVPGVVGLPKRNNSDDQVALVERLKSGDQDAFETLFNLYSAKLYNVAYKILGEVSDTEEVIQDVFWTMYRKAKSFRGNAHISTWLYRLTVNAALGKIRRSKKKKEVEYDEFLPKFHRDGHHLVRPVIDWAEALDEQYSRHEIQGLLKEALDELKPVDKSVVVLSDLEGLSDKEIATTLGLTVSAVKTRLHRARLFLRGKLAARLEYLPL